MIFLLFSITPVFVQNPPRIDGVIEPEWFKAQPITGFTQQMPDEGKPATEKTEVYLLTDNNNLYVAFVSHTNGRKPEVNIRGWDGASGDRITLYLDTFGDRRTCYFFTVAASGTQEDGISSRGGASFDGSWDGIWFASSKITDDGYTVEMKIPFKAIRYAKGKWGVQFGRVIPVKGETDYWKPVPQFPGFRISQFDTLKGINPGIKGRFLEIYPVGILKQGSGFSYDAGIDMSYNPSDIFGLNLTINPDYAQIEADPFQVNLSKYAIYLQEKRPFFLEGQEMFNIKQSHNFNIGQGPMKILYTRNIGKVVDDSLYVPIRAGAKFITKGKGFEGAGMYVNTDTIGSEPEAHYIALRGAKQIIPGFTTGLTYIGKETNIRYTRTLTADGSYVKGFNNMIFQGSYADSTGTSGIAGYFKWAYFNPKRIFQINISHIDTTYDISETGYGGAKYSTVNLFGGRMFFPKGGHLRHFGAGILYGADRGEGVKDISQGGGGMFFFNTRNNWNGSMWINVMDTYENTGSEIVHYQGNSGGFNLGSNFSGMFGVSFWGNLNYAFNYRAGHLGYYGNGGVYFVIRPTPNIGIGIPINIMPYWKETAGWKDLFNAENLEDAYITISPSIGYHFTTKVDIVLRGEGVYVKSLRRVYEYRVNPVISYNISPKSWIYLVYTKTEDYDTEKDKFVITDRGSVFKIRYLFYF